ncbi:MAG: hypothetical protein QXT28_09965 [Thermofilaceae archaeon]
MTKEYWIQDAIEKPGALREWLERNRERIRRVAGEDPFTEDGKIKVTVLKKIRKKAKEGKIRVSPTTLRRINLAITLRRLSRR